MTEVEERILTNQVAIMNAIDIILEDLSNKQIPYLSRYRDDLEVNRDTTIALIKTN